MTHPISTPTDPPMFLDQSLINKVCSGLHKLIHSLKSLTILINNLENEPGKTEMLEGIFSISLVTQQRNATQRNASCNVSWVCFSRRSYPT